MRTRFDHAVVVVDDLITAGAAFRASGFTVSPGGAHDAIPTRNAVVAFADGTYLELLAMRERGARAELRALAAGPSWEAHLQGASAVARRFLPNLAGPDGVADAAIGGEHLARFASESRRREFALTGPVAMERARGDGPPLAWQLLLPHDPAIPFLIEDRTPREERVPSSPSATTHANGARGIAEVGVRVRAAAPAAMALADLFAATLEARADGRTAVRFAGVTWVLEEGAPAGARAIGIAGVRALGGPLEALGLRAATDAR
jgi:hypothetical protein